MAKKKTLAEKSNYDGTIQVPKIDKRANVNTTKTGKRGQKLFPKMG